MAFNETIIVTSTLSLAIWHCLLQCVKDNVDVILNAFNSESKYIAAVIVSLKDI